MKTLIEIKEILARYKDELKVRFKAKEIGIFGSYGRGEKGTILIQIIEKRNPTDSLSSTRNRL